MGGQCHHRVFIMKGPFSGKEMLSYKKCMGCFKSCYWCSSSFWVNHCKVHGVSEDVNLLLRFSRCCLMASVTIPGLQHVSKKAGHDRPIDLRNMVQYPMQVHVGCPSNKENMVLPLLVAATSGSNLALPGIHVKPKVLQDYCRSERLISVEWGTKLLKEQQNVMH